MVASLPLFVSNTRMHMQHAARRNNPQRPQTDEGHIGCDVTQAMMC